jgi:hypothetical protein
MNTWRARIGKVSPSRGDTYVYEFYRIVPKDILLTQVVATTGELHVGMGSGAAYSFLAFRNGGFFWHLLLLVAFIIIQCH